MALPCRSVISLLASSALVILLLGRVVYRASFQAFSGKKRILIPSCLLLLLIGWFVGAYLLAKEEFFVRMSGIFLPNIGLLFIPLLIGIIALSSSVTLRILVTHLSQPGLICVQITRVLGAAFLLLYAQGLMPGAFAFPAGIGDIIVGVTAPIVAYLLFRKKPYSRALAICWNILGFVELVLAIFLGFFTSPTPYQFLALQQPNTLLFAFPLALVPAFAVPLSLLLHIFSLKVLMKNTWSGKNNKKSQSQQSCGVFN